MLYSIWCWITYTMSGYYVLTIFRIFKEMAKETDLNIELDKWYPASEAAPLVGLKEATLKKKLRQKELVGKQVGSKKIWYVEGSEIIGYRNKYNLDGI